MAALPPAVPCSPPALRTAGSAENGPHTVMNASSSEMWATGRGGFAMEDAFGTRSRFHRRNSATDRIAIPIVPPMIPPAMDTAALWPGTLAGTGTTVADDSDGVDEGEAGDIEGVTVSVVVKVAEAETSRVLAEVPDPEALTETDMLAITLRDSTEVKTTVADSSVLGGERVGDTDGSSVAMVLVVTDGEAVTAAE